MALLTADQVQQFYIGYYGRPADPVGLALWQTKDEDAALDGFSKSPEFTNQFVGLSESQQVTKVYNNLLGRAPDTNGLLYWAGELAAGRETIGSLVLSMIKNALGKDVTTIADRVVYSNAFTAAVNTPEEINAYNGPVATQTARTALLKVVANSVDDHTALDAEVKNIDATVAAIVAGGGSNPGQTFTLTTAADVIPGLIGSSGTTNTDGDDTIVGTETTLSSADVIDGGKGTDLLRVANSSVGKTFGGFELSNVEHIQVTSDGNFGSWTNFDMTGTTGVTKLINANSSRDVGFEGVQAIPTAGLELKNVSAGRTVLDFDADAIQGTADVLELALSRNKTVNGGAIGDVQANGIETINVTTSVAASHLAAIASNTLTALNVSGDKSLTLDGARFAGTSAANTLNASGLTGTAALDVTLANSNFVDVAVTGGEGNDRADFSIGFDNGDAFVGGAGRDTLALSQATATALTATNSGTVTDVEILEVTTAATGNINMDRFAGVDTVHYSGGVAAASDITNAVTGLTVQIDVDAANQNQTTTLKTNGTADTISYVFNSVGAADSVGTVSAAQFETVNITTGDDAAVNGVGRLTVAGLTITAATTLNIAGNADLVIAGTNDPAVPVLATINGGTATADISIFNTNLSARGAVVTFGSGDDVYNVAVADGADTITLGDGADTVVYNAVAQSNRNMDTITDFVVGVDVVDVRALMGAAPSSVQFVGNRASFAQAQGALSGVTADAVFDSSEGILWVDVDINGTLDNNDFRVKLDGVTAITEADLAFVPGVTFTANKVAFNTWIEGDSVENNAVTNEDDTINATVAQINDAATVIDGRAGEDQLNISGTAAAAEIADLDLAAFWNVEAISLDNTVEGVILGNAAIPTVTRLAGTAGKFQSLQVDTADLTAMDISNVETLIANVDVTIDEDNFASFSNITGDGTAILQLNGAGVLPHFDFSSVAMTGITTLTLNTLDQVTLDTVDLADVTTINGAADAAVVVRGSVDVTPIAVNDAAVRSIAVAGTLTIDQNTDGDVFETMIGTGGGRRLVIAAGGDTNIENLTGFTTIDALALADDEEVTLDDDITDSAVVVTLGDSDFNATGTSTDNLTVNAAGGVVDQSITTVGGNDTINIDAAATNAAVDAGAGDDIINAGDFLDVGDGIDGGDGNDTLNVGDYSTATTDLDGVTNVETINITNTVASAYTPVDAVVAAGQSILIDASTSAAAVTMDFSSELDGQVNYVASANGDLITFTANNLVDTYTLGAGDDILTLDANNTIANLANVDVVTNFKAAGADELKTGTAHGAGVTYTVNLTSTSLAGFVGDVNTGLLALAGYAGVATDAIVVNVAGGALAGTYLIQDLLGDSITADDFVVKLVGAGIVTAADFT